MKHFIAKKKLLKAHLSEKQIDKIYSIKTKKEQLSAAKRMMSSVKATRVKRFYKTGLGKYVIQRRLEKLEEYAKTEEFKKLSKKRKYALEKEYFKKTNILIKIKARQARTQQAKEDLLAARQDRLDRYRARVNAGEKGYYINRSKEESYSYNNTTHTSLDRYVLDHYPDELERLIQEENMSYEDAIQALIQDAIATGELQALAQGVGYGYIDQDNKEVISPV